MPVDDETRDFVAALDACTLPVLDHVGHVRAAWSCSMQWPLPRVLEELPAKLKRYAASKGQPGIYHETVTYAFACLIHERVVRAGDHTWPEFLRENRDLLDSRLLTRYYDESVLDSEAARHHFVFPAPTTRA